MESVSQLNAVGRTEIRVAGVTFEVPALEVGSRTLIVTGRLPKMATIKDEDFVDGYPPAPGEMIARIRAARGFSPDLFAFSGQLGEEPSKHPFPYELESQAVIPLTTFDDWWNNRVSTDLRGDVRKAAKRGLVIRDVPYTDDFVRGVMEIYNETPVRQGRPFWHYGKDFATVKAETGTYEERSTFLAGYVGEELVGFIKMVYVNRLCRLLNIIAKNSAREKRPLNGLIARALEVALERGCTHLTYGKYKYSAEGDSLTAFKHRNGFEEVFVPRYYVPLTAAGKLSYRVGLHHGVRSLLPDNVRQSLKKVRASIYSQPAPKKAS